jgi:hypothetical protein
MDVVLAAKSAENGRAGLGEHIVVYLGGVLVKVRRRDVVFTYLRATSRRST